MISSGKVAYPYEALGQTEDVAINISQDDVTNAVWKVIEDVLDTGAMSRRGMARELRRAMVDHELSLAYQPIVDIETDLPVAYEALARWSSRHGGALAPRDFVDDAEACGLINELGDFVLEEACHEAATWAPGIGLCVNIAPAQLRDSGLPETIAHLLNSCGLAPTSLEFEITEEMTVEDCRVVAPMLDELRALGLRISLDNFGAGTANLAMLRLLPIDRIKLDRAFMEDIESDPAARAIVRSVLALANDLGLEVVAKGVETSAQLRFLRASGCRLAQGYLIAHPKAASELRAA